MSEELFEEGIEMSEVERTQVLSGIEELDDEERRLQALPSHGKGMGTVEFADIRIHHPDLTNFFDGAPKLLDFSAEQDTEFVSLMDEYLSGKMIPARLKELKQKFFIPYVRASQKKTP